MASRRTRIKGIANIPQRRKTALNGPGEEADESKPKKNEEHNLNLAPSTNDASEKERNVELNPIETVRQSDSAISEQNVAQHFIKPNNIAQKKVSKEVDKPREIAIPSPGANYADNVSPASSANASPLHVSENEYPVPPPSPSKINRSRIKAVPRLGQRNANSASESEDESRRNNNSHQQQRIRNDSVCSSTTSGYQDNVSDCLLSPQNAKPSPKEYNILIQRKCRRTEQSRKLAEARRDFYMKFGNNKPDRQKLTMMDLIFYNPTTNQMSHEGSKKKNNEEEEENNEDELETGPEMSEPATNNDENEEEDDIPAPQIKIGPQGELIIDEKSLVIESKAVKKGREEMQKASVINGDSESSYGLYKKAKRSKDWNKEETIKFYKALNTIGTDFTLMCELFPRRTRRELKMKFKKEERINRALVDKAIMQPCAFDFNEFKGEVEMEEMELVEIEKQKQKEANMRKESAAANRKRKLSSCSVESRTSSIASQSSVNVRKAAKKSAPLDILNVLRSDDEDDEEAEYLNSRKRPTRSGRAPKERQRSEDKEGEEPGTLMVMASTGENGDSIYNVFMVTDSSNDNANGGDNLKNIFTLSASKLVNNKEHEENNVTIPAQI